MSKGKVKFFNTTKGFGFIESEDGNDYFVHVSGCTDVIQEGDPVSFDVTEGKKGPQAENVQIEV